MNVNIKTTTLSLTEAISDYVEKRLEAIKKLLEDDSSVQCDVELAKTTNHHKHGDIFKAEIHIVGKEKNMYASVEEEDLYKAIDMVRDDILEEIRSLKKKKQSLIKRGGAKIKDIVRGVWKK